MTLKDVAKAAGVSPSTVSRIINAAGDNYAGPEVRRRVWQAVRELGYVPNQQAKRLKTGEGAPAAQSVIHVLLARVKQLPVDSYFEELATYVQEAILQSGQKLGGLYTSTEARSLDPAKLEVAKTDGLVVLGRSGSYLDPFIARFKARVVHVSLNQMQLSADHIMCDGIEATKKALQYLYDKGHRHISYVGEYPNEIRYRTYRDFLTEKMLTYSRESIINTPMSIEGGMAAAKQLMECAALPTAVFCANDVTAIGLLKGLSRLGIPVPGRLSVISIDNIAEAGNTKPGLTTVKIPLQELGSFAVKTLNDRIARGHSVALNVFMPSELVIRDSVAAAPRNNLTPI